MELRLFKTADLRGPGQRNRNTVFGTCRLAFLDCFQAMRRVASLTAER